MYLKAHAFSRQLGEKIRIGKAGTLADTYNPSSWESQAGRDPKCEAGLNY